MWDRKADQGAQAHGSWALGQVLHGLRARHSAPPAGATHEGAVVAELPPEAGQAWSRGDPHAEAVLLTSPIGLSMEGRSWLGTYLQP